MNDYQIIGKAEIEGSISILILILILRYVSKYLCQYRCLDICIYVDTDKYQYIYLYFLWICT